nr:MAG TPA: hypothetical protein [Microviridae sp.]
MRTFLSSTRPDIVRVFFVLPRADPSSLLLHSTM